MCMGSQPKGSLLNLVLLNFAIMSFKECFLPTVILISAIFIYKSEVNWVVSNFVSGNHSNTTYIGILSECQIGKIRKMMMSLPTSTFRVDGCGSNSNL